MGRRNLERVTAWKPIRISLGYEDNCQQCNKLMKVGEIAIWRGRLLRVLHEECWNKAMSVSLKELIDW